MTWSDRDCCPEPGHELTAESLKEDISLIKCLTSEVVLWYSRCAVLINEKKKIVRRQRCLVTSFTIFQSVVEQKWPDGLLQLLKLTSKMFD